MKKYIIVLTACMLLLAGCEKEKREMGDTDASIEENEIDGGTEESMGNDNNTTEAQVEYVTAEEFMEYYSITEDQVPADYVQAFLDDCPLTMDDLKRDKTENLKYYLLTDYENGIIYGYNINRIFRGRKASDEALSEYMKQAEVILFDFSMHDGSELAYGRVMVIDLREGKIYFSHGREKEYTQDYINFELAAALSEDDIAAIRKELPAHIGEDKGVGDFGMDDYGISIRMLAADGTVKYFDGHSGQEEYFPGFDEYWKGLYKKYFGKEYEFTR